MLQGKEESRMDALRTIGRAPMQTVRPQDLTATYAHPRKSLADLEQRGVVHKVAHGYYCLVPPEENPATWMPVLEAAAAGVATAKWGEAATVLMGLSAARIHGALPAQSALPLWQYLQGTAPSG